MQATPDGFSISKLFARRSLIVPRESIDMQFNTRIFIAPVRLICLLFSVMLAGSATAQISVTSPLDSSTVPMPVWIRAHVSTCNGNPATAIGYSINAAHS